MDYFNLRRREFETTLRVLEAYPIEQAQMRPAAKSKTAAELAMTLANEERVITALIETGEVNPSAWARELPSSMAVIVNTWQQAAEKNDAMLAKLASDDFARVVDFYGRRITLSEALWIELLDHIHHRGQFSVYLRVVGAKVPSIYGPTAEDDERSAPV
jgi:uncharacterized damage-inducible protein DinB